MRFGMEERSGFAVAMAIMLGSCSGAPQVSAAHGWTREVAPGQTTAAAYVTIINAGNGADRLVAAKTAVAEAATLHSSSSSGGIARMRPIAEGMEIPAHSTVEFKPGGTHIMLTGLKQPFRAGQTFALMLSFVKSGPRWVVVRVVPATSVDDHHGMHM